MSKREYIYLIYDPNCEICKRTMNYINNLNLDYKIKRFNIFSKNGMELKNRFDLKYVPTFIYPNGDIISQGVGVLDDEGEKRLRYLLDRRRHK